MEIDYKKIDAVVEVQVIHEDTCDSNSLWIESGVHLGFRIDKMNGWRHLLRWRISELIQLCLGDYLWIKASDLEM